MSLRRCIEHFWRNLVQDFWKCYFNTLVRSSAHFMTILSGSYHLSLLQFVENRWIMYLSGKIMYVLTCSSLQVLKERRGCIQNVLRWKKNLSSTNFRKFNFNTLARCCQKAIICNYCSLWKIDKFPIWCNCILYACYW